MKETIVTVLITSSAAKKSAQTWQNATFAVISGMTTWKPIAVGGIFTIASEIGSFNLSNHSFASGMMCDLNEWKKYRAEFEKIAKAIDPKVRIVEKEFTIEQ